MALEIPVGSQVFDLVFHPSHSTVYTGLLSGEVHAAAYTHSGQYSKAFSLKLSQSSIRSLSINQDGSHLYAVGKGKSLIMTDTTTAKVLDRRAKAHEAPINRVKHLTEWLLATGDDDGVIKLWDPRSQGCTRTYTHHFDYITDFMWLEGSKQLVTTSADATLSVLDVRSKKVEPFAQSEDQEDELLSVVSIKGGQKTLVGTQVGVISVFNKSSGWKDCVDRLPGHPQSVDALAIIPSSFTEIDTTSTVITGSSDGFVRVVGVYPTELLGVVADHGELPVERIAVGDGLAQTTGQEAGSEDLGRWWIGSVGHDENIRLTSLKKFLDSGSEEKDDEGEEPEFPEDETEVLLGDGKKEEKEETPLKEDSDDDSDSKPEEKPAKRKRKSKKDDTSAISKKGRNEIVTEPDFFSDL